MNPEPDCPILTTAEAVTYTKFKSRSAFHRWAAKNRVKRIQNGRWSKRNLDLGLQREAGVIR